MQDIEQVIERLGKDPEYRERFFAGAFSRIFLQRYEELTKQVAELEAGGANGAVAKELAQARKRITELEEQLAVRPTQDNGREPDPDWVALYNKMRDQGLKKIARQVAAVKRSLSADDWDRLVNVNLGGLCGALLRGDSDDVKSEDDIISKFLQQARRKADLDREDRPAVRRTSPTPAPAGASSLGQAINFDE